MGFSRTQTGTNADTDTGMDTDRKHTGRRLAALAAAAAIAAAGTVCARADDWAFGVRAGHDIDQVRLDLVEIFVARRLPWTYRFASGAEARTSAELAAGTLRAAGTRGYLGRLGGTLAYHTPGGRWVFEVGTSIAGLSESRFGDYDLGGQVQFVSHLGLRLHLGEAFALGYRVQHLSNAGLDTPNPGLDSQALELRYRF